MLSYLNQEWTVSYQSKEQAQKGEDLLSTLQDVEANILDGRSLVFQIQTTVRSTVYRNF